MRSCRDFFWLVQAMNLIRTIFWLIFFHFVLIIKSSLNKKFVMPASCESSSVKICYHFWLSIYKNLDISLLWKLSLFLSVLPCSELRFYIIHFNLCTISAGIHSQWSGNFCLPNLPCAMKDQHTSWIL